MDKRGKQILLFSLVSIIAVALFVVLILNFVIAPNSDIALNVTLQGQTPTVPLTIAEDALITLNFSIAESNTTQSLVDGNAVRNVSGINITLPSGIVFTNYSGLAVSAIGANFSSLYNFTNTSSIINIMNESFNTPLLINGTNKSFWFNVTVATPGRYNITVNVSYGLLWNTTNVTLNVTDITSPSSVQQYNATLTGAGNWSVNDNGTTFAGNNVSLACNVTDNGGLSSVTLFIVSTGSGPTYTNSTPEVGPRTYTQVTGTYNQTNFTQTLNVPGTYKWYCLATDGGGNAKSSSVNYTFTVNDNRKPVVESINTTFYNGYNSLNSFNFSTFNTTTTVNLSCNMSDDFALNTVTLVVVPQGWGPTYTNSTPEIGTKTYGQGAITGTYNQTNFTQTIDEAGAYSWYCQATDTSSNSNWSAQNLSLSVNAFSFTGWVKNTTFNNISGANISIYEFVMGQSGPPTQRIIKSVTTTTSGQFNLSNIMSNASQGQGSTIYKISATLNNSDGDIIEIGPTLPPLPSPPFRFSMRDGTFYLQNATTIRLYAYNNLSYKNDSGAPATTPNSTQLKFGYEVMDQALGFPIESSIQSGVYTVNVSVPSGRNYTIMFVRDPYSFRISDVCGGPGFMNLTDCPAPPLSVSVTSENIYNGANSTDINSTRYLIIVNKSLAFTQANLSGCLNVVGNATAVNITDVLARMVPWEGFVPPIKAEVSDFNKSDTNYFSAGANGMGCTLGTYNTSLMGASAGLLWMVEAYAGTTENRTVGNATSEEQFVSLQNVTMNTTTQIRNITLVKAVGAYVTGGDVNSSKIEIAILDSNGTAPQDAHIELFLRSPVFGTINYMIESLTNGKFNFTFPNNTQEAEVRVYTNQFAPKEQKVKLYSTDVAGINRTNVTIFAFRPMMVLDNGSISDSKMGSNRLTMRFMKYSAACNVYTPADSCKVGDDKSADFDPLGAMMAGKINLWMKTKTNITLYFINVDMMASGPPDAMMNDNASSATASSTSAEQVWKFGSAAPDVYDKVMIGIPYNASIDENMSYVINISSLFDNDWNTAWNMTTNTTAQLPADYADFNTTWFTTGMTCSNTSAASVISGSCFMNITNNSLEGNAGTFWLTIPHFSSTSNKITGSAAAATTTTTTSSSSGGGGGGTAAATYSLGTLTAVATKEIAVGDVISFSIENASHTVKLLGITATSASVQIKSVTITKLLQVGKPAELIDLDADGVNELSISLDSVNLTTSKVTLTITPLVGAAPPVTPAENVTETPAATPEQPPAAAPAAGTPEAKKAGSMWLWIGILSVVVVAIIVVILVGKLKKD